MKGNLFTLGWRALGSPRRRWQVQYCVDMGKGDPRPGGGAGVLDDVGDELVEDDVKAIEDRGGQGVPARENVDDGADLGHLVDAGRKARADAGRGLGRRRHRENHPKRAGREL